PLVRGADRFGKAADPADAVLRMDQPSGRAHQPLGVGTGGAVAAAPAHAARTGRRPRLGALAGRITRGPLPALPGTLRPAAAPAAAGLLRFLPAVGIRRADNVVPVRRAGLRPGANRRTENRCRPVWISCTRVGQCGALPYSAGAMGGAMRSMATAQISSPPRASRPPTQPMLSSPTCRVTRLPSSAPAPMPTLYSPE